MAEENVNEEVAEEEIFEDDADQAAPAAEEEEEEELYEIEVAEEDIVAYLVDEDDNEIGFVIMEDGAAGEYYSADAYEDEFEVVEEPEAPKRRFSDAAYKSMESTTQDLNAIYRDGVEVVGELKGTFDDIASSFDFLNPRGKKK